MAQKRERTQYRKEWYIKNKEKHCEANKRNHKLRKQKVIDFYGGKCACCGETLLDFLAIDHINNDGAEHRRKIGNKSGSAIYSWLINNDFPNGFQVLCHNCNFSKHFNGICIHKLIQNSEKDE